MKPTNISLGIFIDYGVEHKDKDSKVKASDRVRICINKYKYYI